MKLNWNAYGVVTYTGRSNGNNVTVKVNGRPGKHTLRKLRNPSRAKTLENFAPS